MIQVEYGLCGFELDIVNKIDIIFGFGFLDLCRIRKLHPISDLSPSLNFYPRWTEPNWNFPETKWNRQFWFGSVPSIISVWTALPVCALGRLAAQLRTEAAGSHAPSWQCCLPGSTPDRTRPDSSTLTDPVHWPKHWRACWFRLEYDVGCGLVGKHKDG